MSDILTSRGATNSKNKANKKNKYTGRKGKEGVIWKEFYVRTKQ